MIIIKPAVSEHSTYTYCTIAGLKTRLGDQLRTVQYQPWFLFLGGLTKRTWLSVVLGSLALVLIVFILVLTNTSDPGMHKYTCSLFQCLCVQGARR